MYILYTLPIDGASYTTCVCFVTTCSPACYTTSFSCSILLMIDRYTTHKFTLYINLLFKRDIASTCMYLSSITPLTISYIKTTDLMVQHLNDQQCIGKNLCNEN